MERAGKKYRQAAKLIEAGKSYSLTEALELAAKTSPTKFDASIELHINLAVDPKQADQNVRGTVVMPAGTGKDVRVAVLDEVGADKLFAKLDKEEIDFDVLVATPEMMPRLGKYARLLGPRGLMPSPKSGTVTKDTATAVKEAKAGKVEYRVDQAGIIHLAVGKVSFGAEDLLKNSEAIIGSVRAGRPASLKGNYIKSAFVSSTMGPSIKLDLAA
ncbi:MAG TPA: 50S ribosomal protein L1 [Candidatus Saccharimonadales bacterium]|nr:50S ribosomal protein L1 [Candidatus Saccharimonadales bacterium]